MTSISVRRHIASMLDVEQIEVFRGPQGTGVRASALGGLIKVKTRDPNPERELELRITQGQHATKGFDLMINTPVSEQLLLRAAFNEQRATVIFTTSSLIETTPTAEMNLPPE